MTLQKHTAIQTALEGNWENAISINEEILKENPHDTETLNRLAFALTVVGKIKDAKEIYQKVLKIDIFNPIALKNLRRLGATNNQKHTPQHYQLTNNMFLEEHGKTKIISLTNTAQPKLLKSLQAGQPLELCIKRLKIFVLNEKEYIGMLPEDVGKRLIKFIKGGNNYEAYIKSVENHTVTIFIRETKRVAKFKNQPSFIYGDKSQFTISNTTKQKRQDSDLSEEEA